MSIEKNYFSVRENIEKAAKEAGRDPKEITLVAVSKFKTVEDILSAYEAGARNFGENYIQEFTEKYSRIDKNDVLWHIIGPVQRNKAKYITDKNVLIQSLDRAELASELSKQAAKSGNTVKALIQVNTCAEETKSGCTKDGVFRLFEECSSFSNVKICGLMTIGPNTDDMKAIEEDFSQTYEIYERLKSFSEDIKYLSMGMTNDYVQAIKHGANIVRVGRAIFGERYTKQ